MAPGAAARGGAEAMQDPALERRLEEIQELHQRWSQFHDFFNMALKGGKATPQAEVKFLDIKTRIAMLHDSLMQSLTHDQKVGQNVMQIIGACIMLRRIPQLSNTEIQKLEFDWNECYLLMTETIANLEEERERIAGISERSYKMKKSQERLLANINNFFVGPYFKALIIVGSFLFVVFGVPFFGIYKYSKLKEDLPWTAPVYDRVVSMLRSINSEIPFDDFMQIPQENPPDTKYSPLTRDLSSLTAAFISSNLVNLGFPANESDLKEVKELLGRTKKFDKEKRLLPGGNRIELNAFYFLFASTEDAKRFVELRRKGVEALDAANKKKLEETINVVRRANFIGLFFSPEDALRTNFAREKWKLKESEMHL